MLPEIWIFDTYSIMLFLGVIACFFLFRLYGKKNNFEKNYTYTILIIACIAIIVGIISATLFQTLFDYLKEKGNEPRFAMTFYGGLIGGAVTFILIYEFKTKKEFPNHPLSEIVTIAPACITIAHGFGRIGCFCAGCCYGKETTNWLGVHFQGTPGTRLPTQLFEACFLLILSAILFYLAYKKNFKYGMVVYLYSYGLWRFFIEFLRDDERGAFLFGMSPAQVISIIAIIIATILIFYYRKKKNEVRS